MNARWQARSPDALLWEEWESDSTVYDRHTGETHLLGPLPAELIRLLGNSPKSLQELSRQMADLCEVECSQEWVERMDHMLADLAVLSLVEKKSG